MVSPITSKFIFSIKLLFVLYTSLIAAQYDITEDVESTVEKDDCICVPYYQCSDGLLVTDGAAIVDPRQNRPAGSATVRNTTSQNCGPYHVCCAVMTPKQHNEPNCGVKHPGMGTRIMSPNGTGDTLFGEWPWQAAVLNRVGADNVFTCGGTLISKRHVLTVAHCATKLSLANSSVRLGEWDTRNSDEPLDHYDYKISQIIIHPEFISRKLFNDLAILELSTTVTFHPHINAVCLPTPRREEISGQTCVVTGWGKNRLKDGKYSEILKQVRVPLISHDMCQNMLRKTRLGIYFRLHDSFMCAGGERGADACKGDGGGPLACLERSNVYTAVGLVAWGVDCGNEEVPGVYVNLSKFYSWIVAITERALPAHESRKALDLP